jgi:hypothetical protein
LNPRMSESESDALPLGDAPKLVEGAGFEPAKALPTDLQSAPFGRLGIPPCLGAQGRNRTTDTRIFSPLLYLLSYLGVLEVSCEM